MLALQVFFTACESIINNLVQYGFFSLVVAPGHEVPSWSAPTPCLCASVCSARTPLNTAASLWVGLPNYNRSSVDIILHLKFVALSTSAVGFVSSSAATGQQFPILGRLSYWCTAFILILAHLKRSQMGSIKLAHWVEKSPQRVFEFGGWVSELRRWVFATRARVSKPRSSVSATRRRVWKVD